MSGRPPRGYLPFIAALDGRELWCVATPLCDAADALCYPAWLDNGDEIPLHTFTGDWYAARTRILRLFESRDQATHAAWLHAKRWWGGGEPIDVPAIVPFPELPAGYAIWVDVDQREVWLHHPDGTRTGEFSGVSVIAGVEAYGPDARKLEAANA